MSWITPIIIMSVFAFDSNSSLIDSTFSRHNQYANTYSPISSSRNEKQLHQHDLYLNNSIESTKVPDNQTVVNDNKKSLVTTVTRFFSRLFSTPNSIISSQTSLAEENVITDPSITSNSKTGGINLPPSTIIINNNEITSSIAGIDGTGGTKPTPTTNPDNSSEADTSTAGIDGTGGTKPTQNETELIEPELPKGIDGTGGPKIVAVLGALDKQDDYLVINGIKFKTNDSTQTIVDNRPVTNSSLLSNGQVIIIHGDVDESTNTGTAKQVIYTTKISGAITLIKENSITVLEQTIVLHSDIIFGGVATQFSDLQIGDNINVSGFRLSNGDLSATRIDKVENSTDKISGSVSKLNETDQTFSINQLTVNYSQAATTPELSNGMIINIQGATNSEDQSILEADLIEDSASVLDEPVEKLELEGFITKFTDASDFNIGDITISTDLQTEFIGNDRDDLKLNSKIEVEGYLDANNVLVAEKVIFLVANITSHGYRARLTSSTETFTWNDVNAKAYRLRILYTHYGVFYDQEFDGTTTSATVSGLPTNSAFFYVFLYTLHGEVWTRKIYNFYGSGTTPDAELTSHKHGDILESTTETFTWNEVPDAEAYHLRIFNYHSNTNHFEQTFSKPEAITLEGLPDNGADINIHLSTLHNGWSSTKFYDLKSVQLVENASLISHTNGQSLSSSTETFTWKDVGAEQYELRVARRTTSAGVTNGWFETLELLTFDGSTTSVTIDNLPINGGQVLIRLRTKHSGWATKHYYFSGASMTPIAEITSHSNKEVLTSTSQTFNWTEVPNAEEYILQIEGHSVFYYRHFAEDYNSFVTTQTVNDLPRNNATAFVTLSTKHNGYWAHNRYRLKGTGELEDAKINSHTSYQVVKNSKTTITWDNVDADAYFITIQNFSKSGHPRIFRQEYSADTTSAVIENLPDDSVLSIGLSTKHGNWWSNNSLTIVTDIP